MGRTTYFKLEDVNLGDSDEGVDCGGLTDGSRGERCNCTHLNLNRYERVFIELFQFYSNGS
jgi:hypothetical protein